VKAQHGFDPRSFNSPQDYAPARIAAVTARTARAPGGTDAPAPGPRPPQATRGEAKQQPGANLMVPVRLPHVSQQTGVFQPSKGYRLGWNTAFRLSTSCARVRRQFSAPAAAGAQRSLGPACSRAKAVPEDRRPAPRSRFRGPGRFWGYGAAERGAVKVGRSPRGESEAASLADSLTAESTSDATDPGFGRLSWADSGSLKTAPTTF
jgi:hypothetical protein